MDVPSIPDLTRVEEATFPTDTPPIDEPWVSALAICDRALVETDGTVSLIRLIDQATTTATIRGDNAIDESEIPVQFKGTLVVLVKSGGFEGEADLLIRLVDPSGKVVSTDAAKVPLTAEKEHGMNVHVEMVLSLKDTGLYWFEVALNGRFMNRVPLRVRRVVTRVDQGAQAPAADPNANPNPDQ